MKVLFFINFIPPDYGGGYLRAFRQAIRLYEQNKLNGIITLTNEKKYNNEKIPKEKICFLNNKILLPFKLLNFIYKKRKETKAIYIVSPHWYTMFAALYAKLFGIRVIVGITLLGVDSPMARHKNFLINAYYKFKQKQFDLSNNILVNSPALLEELSVDKALLDKTTLLPNPVDINLYKPIVDSKKRELKNKLGLPEEKKIILFVGAVRYRKGIEHFNKYFESVSEELNVVFVICGSRTYSESNVVLDELFNNFNKVEERVIFREEVNNVFEYMQVCDLFFFPSLNEGLPNVILEAMACGVPIVANKLPGITDYLLPKEFLADNDLYEYIDKTIKILNNYNYYKRLIDSNTLKIKSNFSNQCIDEIFLKLAI